MPSRPKHTVIPTAKLEADGLVPITGLWVKKTKNGDWMASGTFGDQVFMIFENQQKLSPRHPDLRMVVTKKRDRGPAHDSCSHESNKVENGMLFCIDCGEERGKVEMGREELEPPKRIATEPAKADTGGTEPPKPEADTATAKPKGGKRSGSKKPTGTHPSLP